MTGSKSERGRYPSVDSGEVQDRPSTRQKCCQLVCFFVRPTPLLRNTSAQTIRHLHLSTSDRQVCRVSGKAIVYFEFYLDTIRGSQGMCWRAFITFP